MPLTREQVRELDRRAIEEYGVPGVVLMENAGRGAAELLHRLNHLRERVAIVCGRGNNGGDGFVMARHLDRLGVHHCIWLCADPATLSPDAQVMFNVVQKMDLPITIGRTAPDLRGFGWVVDGLYGTGLNGPIGAPDDAVVAAINASGAKVLAVDVPSGLDTDTGEPTGPVVTATHTVTFVGMKAGFLEAAARQYVGEIHFVDIGAPRKLVDEYLRMDK